MNKEVNPETKQLLFDKGWRYELSESYDPELGGTRVNHSLGEQRWNEGKNLTYVDITIAEVVMWLYEKHGIWIQPYRTDDNSDNYPLFWCEINNKGSIIESTHFGGWFESPTEAYGAAIEYVLKNLI